MCLARNERGTEAVTGRSGRIDVTVHMFVTALKDTTFQVRINSEIKKKVEGIYAKAGMTLTDAFNRCFYICFNHSNTLNQNGIFSILIEKHSRR